MKIWTLTVDDTASGNEVFTTVHRSDSDALQALFDNYDPDNEFGSDVQAMQDAQGIFAYIDEHDIEA